MTREEEIKRRLSFVEGRSYVAAELERLHARIDVLESRGAVVKPGPGHKIVDGPPAPSIAATSAYDAAARKTGSDPMNEPIGAPAPDASAAGGWQPIETAPKDGRRVLLWSAAWHDDPSSGWFGGVRGWYLAYEAGPFKHQPTHWMPLPPPPASATEGKSPGGEAETPLPLTLNKGGGDA